MWFSMVLFFSITSTSNCACQACNLITIGSPLAWACPICSFILYISGSSTNIFQSTINTDFPRQISTVSQLQVQRKKYIMYLHLTIFSLLGDYHCFQIEWHMIHESWFMTFMTHEPYVLYYVEIYNRKPPGMNHWPFLCFILNPHDKYLTLDMRGKFIFLTFLQYWWKAWPAFQLKISV